MTPSLLMEQFRGHCTRGGVWGEVMSFFHLGLATPVSRGAFRRTV